MRIAFVVLLAVLIVRPAAGQKPGGPEMLTNQSVIDMVQADLPKDLILAKIASVRSSFDLTTAGLVHLTKSKVPNDIIKAMMAAPASTQPSPSTAAATPAHEEPAGTARPPARKVARAGGEVEIPSEPGIYIRSLSTGEMTQLEPTLYTQGKTSGLLGAALSGGLAKAKIKAVVRSPNAAIQVPDGDVEFYFVFEQKGSDLSGSASGVGGLSSPNEFALVRFDLKKGSREVVVAAAGALGQEVGTEEKANVPFGFTKLRAGVYRVVPKSRIPSGEYCFFSAAAVGETEVSRTPGGSGYYVAGRGANRLFDFSVGADR